MRMLRTAFFTFLLAAFAPLALAQTAGTVTLTASPTSGKGSVPVTLSWSTTPAATSCAGSGGSAGGAQGWSGALAASGTYTPPAALITSQTYTVTCTWTSTTATLSWVAPTENTDGSALTNLSSYNVYEGPASPPGTIIASVPAGTTTYSATNLSAGTNYFAVTAVNSAQQESALSDIVSKATTANASATATVTVTVLPVAPANLTVK
jgi:hypothetical protein